MRVLKLGSTGSDVRRWKLFLRGQGFFPGDSEKGFDASAASATKMFQSRENLVPDAKVGPITWGRALMLGLDLVEDDDPTHAGPNWPPRPTDLDSLNGAQHAAMFGAFNFVAAPTPTDPEAITVTGTWVADNLVAVVVPQLAKIGVTRPVRFHRLAVGQFLRLWQAWEERALLARVVTWDGSYSARFVRGSTTTLSAHAYGSAFDMNMAFNRLGTTPALVRKKGSLRELVELANQHGFYWGGHFKSRPDGMHFEVCALRP